MSDISATVTSSELITATVQSGTTTTVSTVGIQGASASEVGISGLTDVDSNAVTNGSVLVYKTNTSKWTATTVLDAQDVTGGQY
jgi:hypothetical protein